MRTRFSSTALLSTALACTLMTAPLTADTVFESTSPENWGGQAVTVLEGEGDTTTLQIALPVNRQISATRFAVDPDATYTLTGEFRISEPGQARPFYFGFRPLDARNREISALSVNPVANAPLTELAAAAQKGDQTLILKDASTWKIDKPHYAVAFGAKDDFSDLPNRQLSGYATQDGLKQREDGTYELQLSRPLGLDQPAGTIVRLHASGGTYPYTAAPGRALTDQWQTFSGKISGIRAQGLSNNQWRPGTVNADVFFFCRAKQDANIEFRNVRVEKD